MGIGRKYIYRSDIGILMLSIHNDIKKPEDITYSNQVCMNIIEYLEINVILSHNKMKY